MNSFDKLYSIYSNIVNESAMGERSDSIGDMVFDLLNSIDPNAKTRSGARVQEVLQDILNELNDIAGTAERIASESQDVDSDMVFDLARKLKMD